MKKDELVMLTGVLFSMSMILITINSNWQTAVGVLLFGWMMNVENRYRS